MKNTLLIKAFCASALIALNGANAHGQGIINTIAGTGVSGFGGDGGPAASAQFSAPTGVATDAAGNIYIADKSNHRIRKISTMGTVSTIAGTALMTYSGMGGPAASASMEYPNAIFIDGAGNSYITDYFADCAYGINSAGTITNVIGCGIQGTTGDGGPAPLARMELPSGIGKDGAGNIYVADQGSNKIRKIDAITGLASTFAGSGIHGSSPDETPAADCMFGNITGICVDVLGDVFVSDAGNHKVIKISYGYIKTIVGNGLAGNTGDGGLGTDAKLTSPGTLFVNSVGNLFICDPGNNNIRVMNIDTRIIHTLAGTGVMGFSGDGAFATAAQLNQPSGIWQDASGVIYIADAGNQRIRTIVGSGYRYSPTLVNNLSENDVKIFPNPTNGSFVILANSVAPDMYVDVYNVVGEKVYQQAISQQETSVSLDQPAGIYQLTFRSQAGSMTKKIVLQK